MLLCCLEASFISFKSECFSRRLAEDRLDETFFPAALCNNLFHVRFLALFKPMNGCDAHTFICQKLEIVLVRVPSNYFSRVEDTCNLGNFINPLHKLAHLRCIIPSCPWNHQRVSTPINVRIVPFWLFKLDSKFF